MQIERERERDREKRARETDERRDEKKCKDESAKGHIQSEFMPLLPMFLI